MIQVVQCDELELMEGWSEDDPGLRNRFAFPISAETGASASSVVYFEVQPRDHCGRHTHSTEEVAVVLEGTAEIETEEGRYRLKRGALAHIPAFVAHDVNNVGEDTLRVVSVFASAAVVAKFEQPLAPIGERIFVVGAPQRVPDTM